MVFAYNRIQKRRREAAARFGGFGVPTGNTLFPRKNLPAYLFLVGIVILLVSLARPVAVISLPKVEGTVILTFDVSGSMSADDLKPTRMEAAKTAARGFIENQPDSVLIGIVAFSDGGISVLSPTNDRAEAFDAIERLVPRRGTAMANGIFVSLNTIAVNAGDPPFLTTIAADPSGPEIDSAPEGWYPSSAIVLLTDGENTQTPPDPVAAADLAADLGVRIYTVGVGSPEGAVITVEGFTVHSRLDEELLRYISETTGGEYYNAGNEDQLRQIYNDLEPKLSIRTEGMEVTSLFGALGSLLFLIGGILSLLWFGRVP
jgi:Ca-activated chloride channel family protein